MTALFIFVAGVIFGGFTVCLIWKLAERSSERMRGGLLDLTGIRYSEGRDASADPDDADELSGGPSSRPPTHLRLIRDNGATEVLVPLDDN